MVRMRTIKQAVKSLRANDSECAISEWWIRQMVKSGNFPSHRAGNKYLVNLDLLEEFLSKPPVEDEKTHVSTYGKLRKIEP